MPAAALFKFMAIYDTSSNNLIIVERYSTMDFTSRQFRAFLLVAQHRIKPVVNVDFCRISLRGKRLPPGTEDFTTFLQSYIARWAGRAGIL